MRVSFGRFEFDSRTRSLARDGQIVDLSPKAFALLATLVEQRPDAVSKEDLYERLWPDTFVEEGNLHNLVSELRRAFDKDQRSAIRTVRGFGYAFVAAAAVARTRSIFAIQRGLDLVHLHEGENVIGRDPDAAILLESADVSRQHARILIDAASATLDDLGSKNGTCLDGKRLTGPVRIRDGAVIAIGKTVLVLHELEPPKETQTVE